MKIYDFVIELKRPSYRFINWTSQLMLLLSIVSFCFVLFQRLSFRPAAIYISLGGVIAWWIYCIVAETKGHLPFYRMGLLIAAAGWYFVPNGGWITLIYLVAALLEKQAKFPQEIAFDKEEIVFNSFPKKRYSWEEMNNVIIKDGIITIDFKNDKLIQKEIQSGATERDEREFNEFCRNRLIGIGL